MTNEVHKRGSLKLLMAYHFIFELCQLFLSPSIGPIPIDVVISTDKHIPANTTHIH